MIRISDYILEPTILDFLYPDTLRDWKNTIPGEVLKKCYFSCWKGYEEYEERNIVKEQKMRRI